MPGKETTKVIVYSDYIWPYCYIGRERVERLKTEFAVESEWRAFELRPGIPSEGMPRPERPGEGKELSSSVKSLADEIGLKMVRPDFIANSRPALEAAEYAKEQGKFEEFHLAVFKAYWEEAKNIGLRSVLREIAKGCGLDGDEMEHRLDEKRYAGIIETQNKEAAQMGVTGIPAYIVGKYFIVGAQPYRVFQRTVKLVQEPESTKNEK